MRKPNVRATGVHSILEILMKQSSYSVNLVIGVITFGLVAGGLNAAERFDWMPAEAASDKLRGEDLGGEQLIPAITITKTPKPTADLTKFTKKYVLEVEKFEVSKGGTNPVETSKGINQALQHAKTVGANHIVFPKGTYLISEAAPVVIDHKNAVVDLNGATLQINSNGLLKYAVVVIVEGAENVRLFNGTLRGDKDTHDYTTVKGTHEWGAGLSFVGGRELEVDHLVLTNMTGDGVVSGTTGHRTRPELLAKIIHSVYAKDLESGAFAETGDKVDSHERSRTIKPYDVTACAGEFEFGYPAGLMGYPFIKSRVYQAYFYDPQMKFIEKRKCLQFRKVQIPEGAKFMHLEFNQPEVTDIPAHEGAAKGGWVARITNFKPSREVHFHHNTVTGNRRLGMAYCGGQKWVIEDNLFEGNGGTAPAFGVDFEDGWELMQDVVFRNNTFKGNRAGDLAVCAGSELLFEGNTFEKTVAVAGRPHNYTFSKNRFAGGTVVYTTRTGIAGIHDNRYENCTLAIVFDTKAVADGLVRKPGQTVSTPPLALKNETLVNVKKVTGTYFNFVDSKMNGVTFVASNDTRLVRFENCDFTNSSIRFEGEGPAVPLILKGNRGELLEAGHGKTR